MNYHAMPRPQRAPLGEVNARFVAEPPQGTPASRTALDSSCQDILDAVHARQEELRRKLVEQRSKLHSARPAVTAALKAKLGDELCKDDSKAANFVSSTPSSSDALTMKAFRKAVLDWVGPSTNGADETAVDFLFYELDVDQNGTLDSQEIATGVRALRGVAQDLESRQQRVQERIELLQTRLAKANEVAEAAIKAERAERQLEQLWAGGCSDKEASRLTRSVSELWRQVKAAHTDLRRQQKMEAEEMRVWQEEDAAEKWADAEEAAATRSFKARKDADARQKRLEQQAAFEATLAKACRRAEGARDVEPLGCA